jgi:hypothetical protein
LPLKKDFGPIYPNFACGEHIDRKGEWLSRRVAATSGLGFFAACNVGFLATSASNDR